VPVVCSGSSGHSRVIMWSTPTQAKAILSYTQQQVCLSVYHRTGYDYDTNSLCFHIAFAIDVIKILEGLM
jgi:hypothetical protein